MSLKLNYTVSSWPLLRQSFFAERFFALFDSDGSSSISLDELLKALNLLIHGSETDKLHFLFQVYDVDGQLQYSNRTTVYSA